MRKITHCILMVSYNHEKYIRAALDSVLDNEILPDKIILRDDCSVDKTWEIIEEYKIKYPDLLDCKRNDKNLGIFQNINQLWKLGIDSNCDVLSWCSCDDFLKKGLIAELNRVIIDEKIDIDSEKFIVITNSEELYPDGNTKLINNYKFKNSKDLLYERLSGNLSYREVGLSRKLIETIPPLRYDVGLFADGIFCLDYETKCERFVFTDFVGSVYRVGVGTVSKEKRKLLLESKNKVNRIYFDRYKMSSKCKKIIEYDIARNNIILNYNLRNLFYYIFYTVKCNKFNIKDLTILISPQIKKIIKKLSRKEDIV